MKVIVHTNDAHFSLRLPTSLMLNGLTARIAASAAREHAKEFQLSSDMVNRFFDEIKRVRRDFPDWILVDYESKDGEIVKVEF